MLNFELAGNFGGDFIKELATGFEKCMDDKVENARPQFFFEAHFI